MSALFPVTNLVTPLPPPCPVLPPPRLIEDFLSSHPSNNLNLPVANTPLSPRCYTALQMAGLSLHTKLVLGPRRAHSLLVPGPPISCGLGGVRVEPARGGREVWGLGAAVRHLCQPCNRDGGLFCNSLEATASCARRDVAGKLSGPARSGAGGRGGTSPRRSPPCATRCPGGILLVLFPLYGPTDPNTPCSTVATAMSLSRGCTAAETGIPPRDGFEGEVAATSGGGDARSSAHPFSRPHPPAPGCAFLHRAPRGFGSARVFPLRLRRPVWDQPVGAALRHRRPLRGQFRGEELI